MTREHNWADNHDFVARQIHRPTTLAEVRRLVAAATKIHAIGSRHSFNAVADSPGDLIDLRECEAGISIDLERRQVTVGAGTQYGPLASHLQAAGFALHNMASLPHITIGGAIATGTHGSGDRLGTLSSAVAAIELVTADGELVQLRRGDAGFDGVVVGLGAFGVVTRVTLDIEPSFALRQDAFAGLPWANAIEQFEAMMSHGYSVSLFTSWSKPDVDRLWIKTRSEQHDPGPTSAVHLGAAWVENPYWDSHGGPTDQLNQFGAIGPWSERLAHFRLDKIPGPGDQLQSEYMLPRTRAPEALGKLRAIGDRIDPMLYISEVRSMAADALWLSPAYGWDTVALHFTWKKDIGKVAVITAEIEDLLLPLGARPHWGKVIHADAAKLAGQYPRLAEFCALAKSFDPRGKFRNAYLERHVFGG